MIYIEFLNGKCLKNLFHTYIHSEIKQISLNFSEDSIQIHTCSDRKEKKNKYFSALIDMDEVLEYKYKYEEDNYIFTLDLIRFFAFIKDNHDTKICVKIDTDEGQLKVYNENFSDTFEKLKYTHIKNPFEDQITDIPNVRIHLKLFLNIFKSTPQNNDKKIKFNIYKEGVNIDDKHSFGKLEGRKYEVSITNNDISKIFKNDGNTKDNTIAKIYCNCDGLMCIGYKIGYFIEHQVFICGDEY